MEAEYVTEMLMHLNHPMSLSAHEDFIGFYHCGSFMSCAVQSDGIIQCQIKWESKLGRFHCDWMQ
jgi:hypothetical protein